MSLFAVRERPLEFYGMEMTDRRETIERSFTVKNRLGLHARAASKFVQAANRFSSEITVSREGQEVNGKSIMGILILAAACGTEITIRAEGDDAREAVSTLGELVENGFDEE